MVFVKDLYAESLGLMPASVRRALDSVMDLMRCSFDGVDMPRDLRLSVNHYIENRGKLMRPTLTLLTSYSLGHDPSVSILPAASVELIHISSLLQDDIIDAHEYRRGVRTPYRLYGAELSMLASDLLIAKAVEYAVRTKNSDIINELISASVRLAVGQGYELTLRGSYVTIEDYMNVVINKTASLIESAMAVGAYSVGVDRGVVERIKEAGRYVGLAFQVRDDVLDHGESQGELNIVTILAREHGEAGALRAARRILDEGLDRAVEILRGLVSDDVMIKYIELLRLPDIQG